jgi:hypothetical protein
MSHFTATLADCQQTIAPQMINMIVTDFYYMSKQLSAVVVGVGKLSFLLIILSSNIIISFFSQVATP